MNMIMIVTILMVLKMNVVSYIVMIQMNVVGKSLLKLVTFVLYNAAKLEGRAPLLENPRFQI